MAGYSVRPGEEATLDPPPDVTKPIHAATYIGEVLYVPGWGWMMPTAPFDTDREEEQP